MRLLLTVFRAAPGLLLMLVGACAAPAAPPRTNHDALYGGATGAGDYDIDPRTAALAQRGPARFPPEAPEADAPKPCEHVWQTLDLATHSFIDPDTGFPSLCTPIACPKCGLERHECQRRR